MDQSLIFLPFFTMMLLTILVWIYMYAKRIPFIMQNEFDFGEMKPGEFASLSPPEVNNPSDNLKNLFEVPMLFYVMCLFFYMTEQVDGFLLMHAWGYVAFRVAHSVVHCTFNHVMLRFWLYCLSCVVLFFMIGRGAVGILL